MSIVSSIYSLLEHSGNKLVSYRNIRIILSNLTGLFAVTAILMAVMTVLCFAFDEEYAVPGFVVALAVSTAITIVLYARFPQPEDLELRHAMIVAALAYLLVPAISMIPFLMIERMSPLDAFFEAISGWTCTGITMIANPEHSPRVIQLWRSTMEWIGGIGVILLVVTILIRPGTSTYIMYQSETIRDKIKPSIRSTIKMIWFLYLLLTTGGVLLFIVVGMPVWDSINHGMVTLGTGGFSIYSDSIGHYDSLPIEIATMIVMILGALPFVFIYKTVKEPGSLKILDTEVKVFFTIIIIGVLLLSAENFLVQGDLFHSIRTSTYQFISSLTTSGLVIVNVSDWSYTSLLILSIAAIIGGCAGSTSGGLKVARAMFLTTELQLWLKKTLLPRNAIVTLKIGGKRLSDELITKELSEAALITFLYLISILVSVMVLSHVVAPEYDLSQIIFSVCSAQGNVGMPCDLINPGMHFIGKILFMINMWIGRLEIIPVTLFIRFLIKGFKI